MGQHLGSRIGPLKVALIAAIAFFGVSMAGAVACVAGQEGFGAGDLKAMAIWSALAGLTVLGVVRSLLHFSSRWTLVGAYLAHGAAGVVFAVAWVGLVALLLGPWIGAFSFPVAILWLTGALAAFVLAVLLSHRRGWLLAAATVTLPIGLAVVAIVVPTDLARSRAQRRLHDLDGLVARMRSSPTDPTAFRELAEYASAPDEWTRGKALAAMTGLGSYPGVPEGAAGNIRLWLAPAVRAGLRDRDGVVRREAALAAASFGDAADVLMSDLIVAVRAHPNDDTGWFAADALGNLGPAAKESLPVLQRAREQADWGRKYFEKAIHKVSSPGHADGGVGQGR